MEELGVDALLLSHGADLPWLTGYRAMPLERLTLLVLPRDGEAVLIVPALEAPRVPDTGGMITLRPWAETEDPVALAAALLAPARTATYGISDRAWAQSLLGAAGEPARRPTSQPASRVTSPLRAVKDADEIAALRAAAARARTPWRRCSRRVRSPWRGGARSRCPRPSGPGCWRRGTGA